MRVCGADPYPPCTGTSDNGQTTTSVTDVTTTKIEGTKSTSAPPGDCSSCQGSEWSYPCLEVNFSKIGAVVFSPNF